MDLKGYRHVLDHDFILTNCRYYSEIIFQVEYLNSWQLEFENHVVCYVFYQKLTFCDTFQVQPVHHILPVQTCFLAIHSYNPFHYNSHYFIQVNNFLINLKIHFTLACFLNSLMDNVCEYSDGLWVH